MLRRRPNVGCSPRISVPALVSVGRAYSSGNPHSEPAKQRDGFAFRRTRSRGIKEGQECEGVRVVQEFRRDAKSWSLRGIV
jgi:hypothetical protein